MKVYVKVLPPLSLRTRAKALAERTEDAYSFDRYRSWRALCTWLLRQGYTDREAEAILRSKWTRWAADGSRNPYGRATTVDLERFMRDDAGRHGKTALKKAVRELVVGTFP